MSTGQSDGASNQQSSMSQSSQSGKKWWDMPLKDIGCYSGKRSSNFNSFGPVHLLPSSDSTA
jgi:hypothetical protein